MKIITILDFVNGATIIRSIPQEIEDKESEDIMEYFCEQLGVRADDCSYLISCDGTHISINI